MHVNDAVVGDNPDIQIIIYEERVEKNGDEEQIRAAEEPEGGAPVQVGERFFQERHEEKRKREEQEAQKNFCDKRNGVAAECHNDAFVRLLMDGFGERTHIRATEARRRFQK